jgi:hypothetical protein
MNKPTMELLANKVADFWKNLGVKLEPHIPDEDGFSFSDFVNRVRCSPRSAQDRGRSE